MTKGKISVAPVTGLVEVTMANDKLITTSCLTPSGARILAQKLLASADQAEQQTPLQENRIVVEDIEDNVVSVDFGKEKACPAKN